MSYFEVTDLDWESFENEFGLIRTDVSEVKNIFRHICKLYVHNDDVQLWNIACINSSTNNSTITYYHITDKKKWHKHDTIM